ncbi:MAG: hypothetical protein CVU50_06675 [Candidatus Cloacimonetes bacterium HGW-Cloacimonetes-3]|jgi:hypothetical protein|nr:MAG: hypothetical protein CVU50_06675 [Candidatus Cloacimonetes bacterium HGW-Cloacimonetes-3]
MKKLLLAIVILTVATLSFAFNAKTFNQQIKITDNDIMSYVSVLSPPNISDPNWFASVTDITAAETITTLTKPASLIRVTRMTGPVGVVAWVIFDVQAFATAGAVPAGRQFSVTVKYLGNANAETNYATKTLTYLSGGAQFYYTIPAGADNAWYLPATILGIVEPVFDYPEGVSTPTATAGVSIEPVGGAANIVIAPLPFPAAPGNPAAYVYQETLELIGAGPWTLVYTTLAPYGAWYSYTTGLWTVVPNVGGVITFVIPVGGKDIPEIPILLGDATLPVEFSSFAATLTAQNFVKLTWVTETETGVSGYNVYRSTDANQATAEQINSTLIDATNTSQTATYTHIDNEVSAQTTYSYWLEIVEMDGTTAFHGPTTVYVQEGPENNAPVLVTSMRNAYPNPFKANTSTNIAYQVKDGEAGTITVYNIIGQVVKTVPVKGTSVFNWNGRDSKNNACGSGIYFYKLSTPSSNVTKKMVIVN